MLRGLIILCLASFAALAVFAQTSSELDDTRARALGKNLRCVVCQNQSIEESDSELAGDMRKLVRARIEAGDSDSEIRTYMRTRYGDYILMQPPFKASTVFLWGLPLLSMGVIVFLFFRMTRRNQNEEGTEG